MKNVVVTVVMGVVLAFAAWSYLSVPVVQKSYSTGRVVACASEATDWQMLSVAKHPACKNLKTAEVEWVK